MADDQGVAAPEEVLRRLDEASEDLADLAEVLGGEEDLGRVLQRTVDQVTSAVPGDPPMIPCVSRDTPGPGSHACSTGRG